MSRANIDFQLQVRSRINDILDQLGDLEQFVLENAREERIIAPRLEQEVEKQAPPAPEPPNGGTHSPFNYKIDRDSPDWSHIPEVDRTKDGVLVGQSPQFSLPFGHEVLNALRARHVSPAFTVNQIADAIHRTNGGVRHVLKYLESQGFIRETTNRHQKSVVWELVR